MRGFREWVRWEFGRQIEVTGFIKFVICERFVKGGLLAIGGILLLTLGSTDDYAQWIANLQQQLVLGPGQGFFQRLWIKIVHDIVHYGGSDRYVVVIAAFLYGSLECFEGFGLIWRKRWAEYLVLVATVAFIPLEIEEVGLHFTFLKLLTLMVNVLIAAYLVWRKRLFLERPGEREADVTAPSPRAEGET